MPTGSKLQADVVEAYYITLVLHYITLHYITLYIIWYYMIKTS